MALKVPPIIISNTEVQVSEETIGQDSDSSLNNSHEELSKLHEENSILNILIRKLLIDEVEMTSNNSNIISKPTPIRPDQHQKEHKHQNMDKPQASAVDILVDAVKENPSLITRIQGLRNLKRGLASTG